MSTHPSPPAFGQGPTFDGSQVCKDLIVTYPNAGTSPQCKCTGSETLCNQISGNKVGGTGKPCPYDASHSCGTNICDDPSTCCDGVSATANSPPQCNNCGCTAPTTSTSTTTTTPGQDPSTATTTSTAIITGDPHIDTFDGQHYLLLKQGSFSFWRFAGSLSWCQGTKVSQRRNDPLVELNCDELCNRNQVYIYYIYNNNHVLVRVKVGRSTTSLQSEVQMQKSSQLPGSNCCAFFLERLEMPRCSSNEPVVEPIPCLDVFGWTLNGQQP